MTHAQVKPWRETLLNPELLQGHLAATLYLLLELAGLFRFLFHSGLDATVFKLHLGTHTPAVAEVVAQHDNGMGQVDAAVSLVFGIAVGVRVAKYVVAIEIVVIHSLPIATDSESRRLGNGVVLCAGHSRCAK